MKTAKIKVSLAEAKRYYGNMKLTAKQWEMLRKGREELVNAMAALPSLEELTESELVLGCKEAQKAVHSKNTVARAYVYSQYIKEMEKRKLIRKYYAITKAAPFKKP